MKWVNTTQEHYNSTIPDPGTIYTITDQDTWKISDISVQEIPETISIKLGDEIIEFTGQEMKRLKEIIQEKYPEDYI